MCKLPSGSGQITAYSMTYCTNNVSLVADVAGGSTTCGTNRFPASPECVGDPGGFYDKIVCLGTSVSPTGSAPVATPISTPVDAPINAPIGDNGPISTNVPMNGDVPINGPVANPIARSPPTTPKATISITVINTADWSIIFFLTILAAQLCIINSPATKIDAAIDKMPQVVAADEAMSETACGTLIFEGTFDATGEATGTSTEVGALNGSETSLGGFDTGSLLFGSATGGVFCVVGAAIGVSVGTGLALGTLTGAATGALTGSATGGVVGGVTGGSGVATVHCPLASYAQPALHPDRENDTCQKMSYCVTCTCQDTYEHR